MLVPLVNCSSLPTAALKRNEFVDLQDDVVNVVPSLTFRVRSPDDRGVV
jgi:hypothetical protein